MGLELSEDGIPLRVPRAGVEARKGDGEDLVLLLGASRKGTYMIHEPKKYYNGFTWTLRMICLNN